MFEKTKGIVLHQIKYDDKKRIVTIYTEKYGRISVIVSNTKKLSINLFRAFNVLDLNLINRTNSNLYRIADAGVHINYKTIPYSVEKSSIAIFLSEVLYKILNEESSNPDLFNFILNSIAILDELDDNSSSFHLVFLIKLSKYFGFFPYESNSPNETIFDLIDGFFTDKIPTHKNYLMNKQTENFKILLNAEYNESLNISKTEKAELLNNVLIYFKIHHESLKEIKSHEVFKEIFS